MALSTESVSSDQVDLREQIRTEIESTRQDFHKLLDGIAPEDLAKPSSNPAWTIGEMLYHMSLAPRNLPLDVTLIRHFKWVPKFPVGPFNRLNVYITRRGARNATKRSLAETYDEAHSRTLKALETVQTDEWQFGVEYPGWDPMLSGHVTLEYLFHYIKRHFESHAVDIRQSLGIDEESGG